MRPFLMGVLAVLLACAPAPDTEPLVGQEMEEEWVQLLASSNGRYHKGGWNHYGPGYFDLDPETGILTSHGGMGLFWYSVQEFGDFSLELEFRCLTLSEQDLRQFLRFLMLPDNPYWCYVRQLSSNYRQTLQLLLLQE